MSGEAMFVRSWSVGPRTVMLSVPSASTKGHVYATLEWSPDEPADLDEYEAAQYLEGRDQALADLPPTAGITIELFHHEGFSISTALNESEQQPMNGEKSMEVQATPLNAARDAFQVLVDQLESINQDMRRAEQGVMPVQQAAGTAQSLKQQKRGLLARMLKAGRIDVKAPEIKELDKKIATAEVSAEQSADVLEALREVMADLQSQANDVHAKLPAARRALAEAQFEAAAAEIRTDALPAFVSACEALRKAYGRLAGLGTAHCQMAREILEIHGSTVGAIGSDYPMQVFDITAIGFGLENAQTFNAKTLDAREDIAQARTEALARWRAA